MMNVFVDIDSTLVLWKDEQNPSGIYVRDEWTFNTDLIISLESYKEAHSENRIIMWSSGGTKYAETWFYRLNRMDIFSAYQAKVFGSYCPVAKDDICVDDEKITVPCVLYTWQDFCKAVSLGSL